MNWVFVDPLPWDYDVDTPLVRALGGSQSALCYLAKALARRGHTVATLTATTTPRETGGVHCLSRQQVPAELLHRPQTIVVELNGPASIAGEYRRMMPRGVPLILWTQIIPFADDQVVMTALRDPACRALWDRIVCVSNWHQAAFHAWTGVPLSQMSVLKNAIGPAFENLFHDAEDFAQAKSAGLRLAYTSAPFRGLDVLLSCFPELKRRHPTCQLDVFSSLQIYYMTHQEEDFQALYDRCRATDGAVYHASVAQPQLARELRGASILAYPCTWPETSCIAAMEALAAGAAVVTCDMGALTETCAGFGQFIRPLQPPRTREQFLGDFLQALDAAVTRTLADPAAFAFEQFEQVRAISAEYTWDRRAAEWEAAGATWLAR